VYADQAERACRVGGGSDLLRARCVGAQARAARRLADHPLALTLYRQACTSYEDLGFKAGLATALRELAVVIDLTQEGDEALVLNQRALALYQQLDNPTGQLDCLNGRAEFQRARGLLAEAEASYRACLDLIPLVGEVHRVIPILNLGLLALTRRDFIQATDHLTQAATHARLQGRTAVQCCAMAGLMTAAAGQGQHETFQQRFLETRRLVMQIGFLNRDIATCAELASDEIYTALGPEHWGRACLEMAIGQLRTLHSTDAKRLTALLRQRYIRTDSDPRMFPDKTESE
jgi:tetratricopeptide (TPR) repeat protein